MTRHCTTTVWSWFYFFFPQFPRRRSLMVGPAVNLLGRRWPIIRQHLVVTNHPPRSPGKDLVGSRQLPCLRLCGTVHSLFFEWNHVVVYVWEREWRGQLFFGFLGPWKKVSRSELTPTPLISPPGVLPAGLWFLLGVSEEILAVRFLLILPGWKRKTGHEWDETLDNQTRRDLWLVLKRSTHVAILRRAVLPSPH